MGSERWLIDSPEFSGRGEYSRGVAQAFYAALMVLASSIFCAGYPNVRISYAFMM